MKLTLSQGTVTSIDVDLLVIPVAGAAFEKNAIVKQLDAALDGELLRIAKLEDFTGKKGQALQLHTMGKIKARKLRLHTLASKQLEADECRIAGVAAARSIREAKSVALFVGDEYAEQLEAFVHGFLLGDYKYKAYLTTPNKPKAPVRASIVLERKPTAADRRIVDEAVIVADAVNLARDLVNAPPNEMTAAALANEARRVARETGIRCTVWGNQEILKRGMTLLAAVNAGSHEEPRFIHMVYAPPARGKKKDLARVVFVGKGLTFDSGGLCLKPAKSMETMKCDMAGGAVTLAVIAAAARLKLPVEVHAVIPSTDNMLGDNAFKPGDIYRTLGGKTVEILNTDAEGRLILADALTYARKLEPTVLVDHATLTGACMVALGQWRAGLYANDEDVLKTYQQAAKRAGEALWAMPLDEELRETIKSPVADIKNTGDGFGGSISAALFLREFVGDTKWVHLDIAGPAFLSAPHGVSPKGGTGFGVRTALEFIKSYA